MHGEPAILARKLSTLKETTSWSWERLCRELHRVMGEEGPSHTTLFRYATGRVKRRNLLTERYVAEAMRRLAAESAEQRLLESETRRKRAEKQLEESELRFREIVENARDIIFRRSVVAPRRMEYVSPAVNHIVGYAPEDFYNDPDLLFNIIHPDDRQKLESYIQGGMFGELTTLRYIHKNGSLVWIERMCVPIYDKDHNLIALEGIGRNVTERKLVEDQLRENENKFRRLVENVQDGYVLYSYNPDGRYTYVSPSITNILGYSQEEFLTHFVEYLTEDCIADAVRHSKLSIRGEQQPSYEVRIFHRSGDIHTLEINEIPVLGVDGEVISVEGIARDVIDNKRVEESFRQRLRKPVE